MCRMMKKIFLLLFAALCCVNSSCWAGDIKGHLFIIGGGSRPDSLMAHFIELGGGPKARILIVPYASGDIHDTGSYQQQEFQRMGCTSVEYISVSKEEINSKKALDMLEGVTAVFFSGGDQNRLTAMLLNTKFLEKIKEIYRKGGVVGGTSAGAAVMSRIMLTGDEKNVPEKRKGDFSFIKAESVQTAEGFGFVEDAIIDQHFIIRKRENRLISVVLQHPDLKGIGIDESTAIIINPDHTFQVAGQSQVMVFEPVDPVRTTADGYLKTNSLNIRILTAGDSYRLK